MLPRVSFTSVGAASAGGWATSGACASATLGTVRPLFSREKLRACGTAAGGEGLPSEDPSEQRLPGAGLRGGAWGLVREFRGGGARCAGREVALEEGPQWAAPGLWFLLHQED